jgi:hypothetical protein
MIHISGSLLGSSYPPVFAVVFEGTAKPRDLFSWSARRCHGAFSSVDRARQMMAARQEMLFSLEKAGNDPGNRRACLISERNMKKALRGRSTLSLPPSVFRRACETRSLIREGGLGGAWIGHLYPARFVSSTRARRACLAPVNLVLEAKHGY